ncbi:uricase/urate oxidase [Pseudomonas monteilii]|uniref:Probable 2-phosphosulfolactate phosphatase n=1 Tax=Pseudomonas monteilii TaxID=76759 RepID=A0AAE6V325_9PSED|nr:2-phosphosulfolactate phosphatase [Pseudomonas monteilii]QHB28821.1 uricase/urate oxidase [Pseudomonas monteilii]
MKPKLTTTFRIEDVDPGRMSVNVAVLIDVIGTTSVLSHALEHGASAVHVMHSELDAHRRAQQWSKDPDNTEPLIHCKGWDESGQFRPVVHGQQWVITSVTYALIQLAASAQYMYAASLLNASAVVARLLAHEEPNVDFLCASPVGRLNLIDLYTTGYLIEQLINARPNEWVLSESSRIAVAVYHEYRSSICRCIADSHGGRAGDIQISRDAAQFIARIDQHSCLPIYKGDNIFVDDLAVARRPLMHTLRH